MEKEKEEFIRKCSILFDKRDNVKKKRDILFLELKERLTSGVEVVKPSGIELVLENYSSILRFSLHNHMSTRAE